MLPSLTDLRYILAYYLVPQLFMEKPKPQPGETHATVGQLVGLLTYYHPDDKVYVKIGSTFTPVRDLIVEDSQIQDEGIALVAGH